MAIDKLKIFISGKQGELDDERATVKDFIENIMGFEAKASEGRAASDMPIKKKYRKEVHDSDIYVGIFGKIDSPASFDEFDKAREYGKPRLIFVKWIDGQREQPVQDFIDKMKDGRIKLTFKYFEDVIDLRDQVRLSIIETITHRFRKEEGGI